ncbi:hypothetical protein [Nitrospira moscoviensis]|uniref:Nucleotidyltransferase n=1 Tax=Nitrospira moscoviensis TaxID=42253 RepID=A0A0K2GDI5_NITMO|nr:hypothetical protein [Nitrospira moscoviensis]ALA59013.1 hypothetical protein NITMOv2_2600 [Nitrospira moscoviensis]
MELYELLEQVVGVFDRLAIPYFVTGSVASMSYGEPRLTNDIDLVAGVRLEHVAGLLAAFPPDAYYVSEDAIRDAIRHQTQFNVIHPQSGLKVDVMVRKDTPFDRSRFARARSLRPTDSYTAFFASPEDVIIKKMEYYREGGSDKHLRDITGMLKISGYEIDSVYISEWAERLGLQDIWTAIQQRLKQAP